MQRDLSADQPVYVEYCSIMRNLFGLLSITILLVGCAATSEPEGAAVEVARELQPPVVEEKMVEDYSTTSSWPAFTAFTLFGEGDDVIVLDQAIDMISVANVRATTELRQLSLVSLGANGEYLDLLVNTISPYQGAVLIEGHEDTVTAFEVTATGNWEITISSLDSVPVLEPGVLYEGLGDTVLTAPATSGLQTLDVEGGNAERQLAIWGYGLNTDLLVNTISPYSGTVRVSSGTELFAITATGPWSLFMP
jgi:hypothetical protein